MIKRNVLVYMIFLFVSSVLLFACSSETAHSEHALINVSSHDQFGMNEQGVLMVEDGITWFYDFETEEKVIACNLPDCPHEAYHPSENPDPICLAAPPGFGITAIGMYENNIYMFVGAGLDGGIVYEIDLANSHRKELTTFDWQLSGQTTEFIDGLAYFEVRRPVYEEENWTLLRTEYAIMSMNIETGETQVHGSIKDDYHASISFLRKGDDKIYYEYFYQDDEDGIDSMADDYDHTLYMNHHLYELDLNTNEERIVFDIFEGDSMLSNVDEDRLYFTSDDYTEIMVSDWEFSEQEVLLTGDDIGGIMTGFNNGIIYIEHPHGELDFNHTYHYYDFESNETKSVTRPDHEFHTTLVYDDWLIFPANFSDGQSDRVMMKLEDYLAGSTDYIYLKTAN